MRSSPQRHCACSDSKQPTHCGAVEPLMMWMSSRASTSAAGRSSGSMTSRSSTLLAAAVTLLAPSSDSNVASVGSRKAVLGGGSLNNLAGRTGGVGWHDG